MTSSNISNVQVEDNIDVLKKEHVDLIFEFTHDEFIQAEKKFIKNG